MLSCSMTLNDVGAGSFNKLCFGLLILNPDAFSKRTLVDVVDLVTLI